MAKHPNIRAPYDPGKAARERFKTAEPVRPPLTPAQRRGVRIGLLPEAAPAETLTAQTAKPLRPKSSPKPSSLKRDDPGRK